MRTLNARLRSGVHLLMAPYMGMFMPLNADETILSGTQSFQIVARTSPRNTVVADIQQRRVSQLYTTEFDIAVMSASAVFIFVLLAICVRLTCDRVGIDDR